MVTTRLHARPLLGITVLALLATTALPVWAQGPAADPPRYDRSTEATVKGTVETVEQITGAGGRGRRGLGGTHITLKTSDGLLTVHLGPVAFLSENKVVILKGDMVEVVGSRITLAGEPVLLAREVRKGDSLWTLRDAGGLPLWRGRGRQ